MTPLAYVETGPEGVPLVMLVHGSMDRMAGFAKVTRRLDGDHRVLRYDRRGHARSLAVGPPFTIAQHADDLLTLLDGRRAIVLGHSLGGNVVLAAAQRAPELVRAAVVYEPPLSWEPWWPGQAATTQTADVDPADVAERFLRRMIGHAVWEHLPSATRAARRAEGPALVGELRDGRDVRPWNPARIAVPVIAARGELTSAHHLRGTAWIAEALRCPLVTVPGAGHGAHSSHPDAIAALVLQAEAATS